MFRLIFVGLALAGSACPPLLLAQVPSPDGPVIDTIIIVTDNLFTPEEAARDWSFRLANGIRFKTRAHVVRRELLFRRGDRYEVDRADETARNLRALGLFRFVGIDTTRVNGRFAVVVRTQDGWSTQIQLNAASTGGTLTWSAGVTETNFIGTGNRVGVSYFRGVDRNSVTVGGLWNRVAGSRVRLTAAYQDFTDGRGAQWILGLPWRANTDRHSVEFYGEWADRRALQFRVPSTRMTQTTEYWRRAFRNGFVASMAALAENRRYLRVGVTGDLRRESFVLPRDTVGGFPDSTFAAFGVFAEYSRASFRVVTHFNGFGLQEDLNLSTTVRVAARVAPSGFGYERSGFGPSIVFFTGVAIPRGYVRASVAADGVFDSAGLDSGRVNVRLTVAQKFAPRHATFLLLHAGALERPPPGQEFDLGHGAGPRSFGPHAFVGTRAVWGTFEHQWFVVDDLYDVLGIGLAAFVDYGGAWYPDQRRRLGGNVGIGLRLGANRSTGANTGRIDLGYRFADGFDKRWAVSFGRGFVF
jgi:hypothetical protein